MKRTVNPFIFYSRLHLYELTGINAKTIPELLKHLRSVPGSCIYQHTHHFIQQRQFLAQHPRNVVDRLSCDAVRRREWAHCRSVWSCLGRLASPGGQPFGRPG